MHIRPTLRYHLPLLLLFMFVVATGRGYAQNVAYGPYFGGVTDTSVQVLLRASAAGAVTIEIAEDGSFGHVVQSVTDSARLENDFVIVTEFSALRPSTEYYCRAHTSSGAHSATHRFTTFPSPGTDAPFRFTFGSCMTGPPAPGAIFPRMARDSFLFFIQDGDWRYPDGQVGQNFQSSDSLLRIVYRQKFDTTYPVHAILGTHAFEYIWDDHDFGSNNCDGTTPDKARNMAAYRARIPHYALANDSAGLWHTFLCGNVRFIVCDLRSQRSPDAEAFDSHGQFNPPAGHSILAGFPVVGEDQRTWLLRTLRTSTARWNVIVSSVPFMPAWTNVISLAVLTGQQSAAVEIADKWAGFPADIDSVERTVRDNHLKNIVVISGDVHNSAMDNGSHAFFPEVVAANLDIPNSGLYQSQKNFGIDVFSQGGQTDSLNAYGRITVRTAPRHSLLLEIIDEAGKLVATYTMEDSSLSTGVREINSDGTPRLSVYPVPGRRGERTTLRGVEPGSRVSVTDLFGRTVWSAVAAGSDGTIEMTASTLPSGMYNITTQRVAGTISRQLWPVE